MRKHGQRERATHCHDETAPLHPPCLPARQGYCETGRRAHQVGPRRPGWRNPGKSRKIRAFPPLHPMPRALPKSIDETHELLGSADYVADRSLATALYLSLAMQRPLFLEGEAGT